MQDAGGPGLFDLRDIVPNGFRIALYGFDGDIDSGEQFQLCATALEAGFTAQNRDRGTERSRRVVATDSLGASRTMLPAEECDARG